MDCSNDKQKKFIEIVKEVEKDFPEINFKMNVSKETVVFDISPYELHTQTTSLILGLLQNIQRSLDHLPDSPIIDELENSNDKLRKALLMLTFSNKDMFKK